MAPPTDAVIAFASAFPLAALGVALVLIKPRTREQGFFGAFAVLWGVQVAGANLGRVLESVTVHAASLLFSYGVEIVVYLLLVHFAVLMRPRADGRVADFVYLALAVAAAGVVAFAPQLVVQGFQFADGVPVGIVMGPAALPLYNAPFYGAFFFALVWLYLGYRESRPGAERERLGGVLVALALFTTHATFRYLAMYATSGPAAGRASSQVIGLAALFAVGAVVLAAVAVHAAWRPLTGARRWVIPAAFLVPAVAAAVDVAVTRGGTALNSTGLWRLATVGALVYALARHRLFDLDLKVKWTVERGTVATAFVALYVIASQAAQSFLTPQLGNMFSLVVTGSLIFAIVPLTRFAERFATTLLPQVEATPQYFDKRRADVYRAALEFAAAEGNQLTPRQERAFDQLRERLGLSPDERARLDYEARTGARLPTADVPIAPGATVLDKFAVKRLLGEGAHGQAFLAQDTAVGRDVVLKTLEAGGDANAALKEARAIAAIRHPNVVTLYGVERVGRQVIIVMEYLEAGSLREYLQRGALAPHAFRTVASDLLGAVGAVHAAGTVHRDIKPSNVLLTTDGHAKLADFGVARQPGFETTMGGATSGTAAVGTIRYMSPEQARGKRVTPASDLYGVGATLFEALVGEPYVAVLPDETPMELQMRVADGEPFARDLGRHSALAPWFEKALAPRADERFASSAEMAAALDAALASDVAVADDATA